MLLIKVHFDDVFTINPPLLGVISGGFLKQLWSNASIVHR